MLGHRSLICLLFNIANFWYLTKFSPNKAFIPIFGHKVFGHNSPICGPIGLKILMVTQETIIYRLVMRNQSYNAYFWFLATFGTKMGVATTCALNVLGLQDPTKRLAHWVDLLGLSLSRTPPTLNEVIL